MLSFILGLIPGLLTTINGVTNAIANERIALINATTGVEKAQIQGQIEALQAKRDVLIADSQHSSVDIWMRTFIAIGPAAYLCKIFIYDKILQHWTLASTDPLDTNLWNVVMAVLGFYFLSTAAITVAKVLKA